MLYATQNSLASEACREELAYALDRALRTRGADFPIIAVFPSTVDSNLIPPSIRVRLFISLTDPDWKERTVAAVERRSVSITSANVQPYIARHLAPVPPPFRCVLEFRPRAGVWHPFIFVVPVDERERVGSNPIRDGPASRMPPVEGMFMGRGEGITDDGRWYFWAGYNPATPTHSYYAFLLDLPSKFGFGQEGTRDKVFFMEGIQLIPDWHLVERV